MSSPFPGMDPYLEDPAFWEDFHRRLITQIADWLLERLPPSYDARIDQRVRLVQAEPDQLQTRMPDVAIDWVQSQHTTQTVSHPGERHVAMLEPVTIPMAALHEQRDVWIEVVHLPERELVTAIEVLSPSNKSGDDAAEYHQRRIDLYSRHVNLVELDLLRGGKRLPLARPLPRGDYYALIARDVRRPDVEVYAWGLRDPLPVIPVPLRSPDPDIRLDLSSVFGAAYERGRYARRLRRERALTPPLDPPDAQWVKTLLEKV